jgi:hypothetical protein
MADAKKDAKDAVQDILDSRREFTLETSENEILHCYIASPSGEDIRKADWQYSKVYNQAIVDEFLTQSQMLELLQDKGIVDEEYTQKLETVRISLGAELFKLEALMDAATDIEKQATAMEVARLRDELFQLNQRVNGPMANTCENLAEDARTDFLTSRIIQKKDGSKVWEDFESYRDEGNPALSIKARFEVMLWMQGLESNFLENTPEQTMLREIAQSNLEKAIEEQADQEAEISKKEVSEGETPSVTEAVKVGPVSEDLELPEKPKAKPKTKAKVPEKPAKKKGRPKGSKNKKPQRDE